MYIQTIYRMGDIVEVKKRSFALLGAPGRARRKKKKETSEGAKKNNQRARARNLQRLLLANFKEGDLHIVLQYRKEDRPQTYEEAKKRLRLFIRRIKRYYKDRGHELKYIAVTERGKKRAVLHHHIILQSIDENGLHTIPAVSKCWKGYIKASVMYADGNFQQLAEYLVKAAGKEEEQAATYMRSRNLIIPQPERRIIFKKCIGDPDPPPGYMLIKDSVEDFQTEYGKHQRYLIQKTNPEAADPQPKGILQRVLDKIKGILW